VKLFKNFSASSETTRLINLFTRAFHRSLTTAYINSVLATPSHHSKIHPIIIQPPTSLSSWRYFSFSLSYLYPIYIPLPYYLCYMPAHLTLLDLIILIILNEEHKLWNFSLCSQLHSAVDSSFFSLNILLSTPLLNTLGLYSSLNVRNQVSRSCRTKEKLCFCVV
jgi:hypothetical protein